MRTREERNRYQLEYYYRNREKIIERNNNNRDDIDQKRRDCYWIEKTGRPWNMAFIKYIKLLLDEDKRRKITIPKRVEIKK